MANPNINSATTVIANNNSVLLSTLSASQLISNAASSNKIYLIDSIIVANTTAATVTVILSLYNSATNSGTAYELMPTISVPANSTLVLGKSDGLNIKEDQSIYITAGTANALKAIAFWKEYS